MHNSSGSRHCICRDFDHFLGLEVIVLSNLISRHIDTLTQHRIYKYNMYCDKCNSFQASLLLRWDTRLVFSLDSISNSEYEPSQTLSSQQNGFTCSVVQRREIDLSSSLACLEIFFLLWGLLPGSSCSSKIKLASLLLPFGDIEHIVSSCHCFQKLCNCCIQSLYSCRILLIHNKQGEMR